VPIRNSAGEWVRSDKHRASTFAEHLQNVFQPKPATNNFEQTVVSQTTQNTIEFRPTEIAKIIKELKPNKSPGSDLINPKMIIELPFCAVQTICQLFNAINRIGHFPSLWKKSIIIMIRKPVKDDTVPLSCRPISLLSCMSKLFEKCLLTFIIPYLRTFNKIPEHQFGFQEKQSNKLIESQLKFELHSKRESTAVPFFSTWPKHLTESG